MPKERVITINVSPELIADYYVMNDTVTVNHPYLNIYDKSIGTLAGNGKSVMAFIMNHNIL